MHSAPSALCNVGSEKALEGDVMQTLGAPECVRLLRVPVSLLHAGHPCVSGGAATEAGG